MEMIERFLHYIGAEKNLSPNTVAAYGRDLREWRDYSTAGGRRDFRPDDMSAADLRAWLASCRRHGCSALTLRRKLQSLRAFYRYMNRHEGFKANPAAEIQSARIPRPLPVQVRAEETCRILDTLDADAVKADADFETVRDALILEILYATGMRCQELIDLEDTGVDTGRGTIRVMGKRSKERIVPLAPRLAEAVTRYRVLRGEATGLSATDTFFVRHDGRPLYRKMVYNIVHGAMKDTGVHAARMSPHVMRHSCATDMLNAGADLNSVRELLGHASLATTQIYTHLTYRELQQNYQHAHPRALKKTKGV